MITVIRNNSINVDTGILESYAGACKFNGGEYKDLLWQKKSLSLLSEIPQYKAQI